MIRRRCNGTMALSVLGALDNGAARQSGIEDFSGKFLATLRNFFYKFP